jgi:hypothetical protein
METKPDKNIPMPPKGKSGNQPKYPWYTMEVGDSFPATCKLHSGNGIVSVANARYSPRKFEYRIVEEEGVKLIRVWRVE